MDRHSHFSKVTEEFNQSLKEIQNENNQNKNNILRLITDKYQLIKNQIENEKINLVFFGKYSSGKTTAINTQIKLLSNSKIKLPSSGFENTYYITVIESSIDGKFHFEKFINDQIIEEETLIGEQNSNIEIDINKKLEDLDSKSSDILELFQNYNTLESDDETLENEITKIHKMIVLIKIPEFPNNLRLVDTPGYNSIMDYFFDFLDRNNLFNIFIYVRNICEKKINDETGQLLLIKLKKKYKNSSFILMFTYIDEILKEIENNSNLVNYKKNFKKFLFNDMKLEENSKEKFIISNFLFQNNIEEKNKIYIEKNKNFKNIIEKILNKDGDFIKTISFLNKTLISVNQINNENINEKKSFEESEIECLKKVLELSRDGIRRMIFENWKNIFPKDIKDFKSLYSLEIRKIRDFFDETNRNKLNNTVFVRKWSYIKILLDEMQNNEIFTEFISAITKDLIPEGIKEFMLKLNENSNYLNEKIKNRISQGEFLNQETFEGQQEFSSIFGLGGSAILGGLAGGTVSLILRSFTFLFSVYGWIVFTIVTGLSSLYSLKDNIGIWKRESCFDIIIENIHNSIYSKKDEIGDKVVLILQLQISSDVKLVNDDTKDNPSSVKL